MLVRNYNSYLPIHLYIGLSILYKVISYLRKLITYVFCVPLVFIYEVTNILCLLWGYMLIYNASIYIVFFTLFQYIHSETKTMYSLVDLGSSNFFSKTLILALFSMAGVPPFWGFFSKVFIFSLLCNSNLFLLFPFFLILIFISLYFYMQNIRFLNSTGGSNFTPTIEWGCRTVTSYYIISLLFLFFLVFGAFFTEDLLIVMV